MTVAGWARLVVAGGSDGVTPFDWVAVVRYKATGEREFKITPRHEAGPQNHPGNTADTDQLVVDEVFLRLIGFCVTQL